MPRSVIELLSCFNAKERFFLIGFALDNRQFTLGDDFRSQLSMAVGLEVPRNAFVAMDYHLDWLCAALYCNKLGSDSVLNDRDENEIKGQQEDVDFLVAFENNQITHVILIEAKGFMNWSKNQMKSKASRLKTLFGADGKRWPHVVPHFVVTSPKKPPALDVKDWPDWCKPSCPVYLELKIPSERYAVSRCDENGKNHKLGKKWIVRKRRQ